MVSYRKLAFTLWCDVESLSFFSRINVASLILYISFLFLPKCRKFQSSWLGEMKKVYILCRNVKQSLSTRFPVLKCRQFDHISNISSIL